MSSLRIAHLIDLDKVGGVESLFVDFIRSPPPDGLSVQHFTIADSPRVADRFAEPALAASAAFGTPRYWGPIKLPRRPHAFRALRRLQLIRGAKPDVLLAWNQFTDFRREHLNLPCPLVYYEHGMSWYSHSPELIAGFLPNVAMGIGASRAAARMLTLKHHPVFPVEVCRNPVRLDLVPREPPIRDLPADGVIRLGVAARLVPLKAVGLAVLTVRELIARGLKVTLQIAGSGPEQGAIRALIQREGLGSHIRMLGLVTDMRKFYRNTDILLSTSMHETMPLVCLEAMAWGVPVVASRIDGFPEVVRDRESGLLLTPALGIDDYAGMTGASTDFARSVYEPNRDCLVATRLLDPLTIADSVAAIVAEASIYRKFSRAARASAATWPSHADWLARLYELLQTAAHRAPPAAAEY
jgi:glycosyltransferase involved in cell wall biosynthesis